jgi:hypothetical protein
MEQDAVGFYYSPRAETASPALSAPPMMTGAREKR